MFKTSRLHNASPDAPVIEELEPRILLSAGVEAALAGDALTVGEPDRTVTAIPTVAHDTQRDSSSTTRSLVFVDAATPGYQVLVEQLAQRSDVLEVIVLDSTRGGIEQISEALVRYQSLDAVHVFSHGADGELWLGNTTLTGDTLTAFDAQIEGWGDALAEDADLLFYGCDLAAGDTGRALVANLARLTGADVAASDDATGHAALGGDWDLELQSGRIEAADIVTPALQKSWMVRLGTLTFQEGVGGYTGTQDTYLHEGNASSSFGSSNTIIIDLDDSGDELQALIRFDNIFGSGAGQIPLGATILSATVTIDTIDPSTNATFSLHRMLQPWSEGSTWNSMSSGIQLNDVEARAIADSSVVNPGAGPHTFTGLATALQAWSDGASNLGWALIASGGSDGWDINSSEALSSALRPRLEVTFVSHSLSGTVYEDLDGDGTLGDAVAATGVTVDLYLDDGDGVIDAGDGFVGSTTTDGAGAYTFTGLADGTYWAVVDSVTITPDAGFNATYSLTDVWAEQTYGSAGAVSFNGSYSYLGSAGAFHGGMQGEVSDDASALTSAEHVTRVTISGGDVSNVDWGFSFNAVTQTGDGDDDPGNNRSVQGSLRQFIQNSNAITGTQSSLFFIPTTDSGFDVSGNGEYRIQVTGSGFDFIDDTIILDATNQAGYAGDPIVELDGNLASGVSAGLVLRANDSTIRGFIVHSFDDEGIEMDGSTGFGDNNTVQNNWIGIDASGAVAGNVDYGVMITDDASGNQIGGTGANDGNVIVNSGSAGIVIRNGGSDNNIVEGNFIGVAPDGVTAMANNRGVEIIDGASGNRIGGASAAARNIISGNLDNGVVMWDPTTTGNIVIGNYIGTNAAGTAALGNQFDGVHIGGGSSNNFIGGSAPGEGNVISGNLNDGIEFIDSGTTGNQILGNYIGLNAAGTAAVGNVRHGVVLYNGVANTTVGGAAAGAGNVISGNGVDGVVIDGNGGAATINNTIAGNLIGTNAAGNAAVGNGDDGINIFGNAGNNTVGGVGAGNVIAGNLDNGIVVESSDNVDIFGNFIGTDAGATLLLGNANNGVLISGTTAGASIGGVNAGEGNVIAHSGTDGVRIRETAGTGNSILGNAIYGNAGLGIDILEAGGLTGVTLNDSGDADGGANNQQNFPLLISSNTDTSANVYVAGTIDAAAATTYRIEFFASATPDASGHGQGAVYLGFITVTTDAGGKASFSTTLSGAFATGTIISSTATAPDGSTSEFSGNQSALRTGILVVDTTLDVVDGNVTSIDALLNDRGADDRISLREALLATNNTANAGSPDEIRFNLQLDDPNRFYYQDDSSAGTLSLVSTTTLADADITDFDPDYPGTAASWFRFQPTGALPVISDALIIDGFSQSGASANTLAVGSDAVMKIVIDGDLSGNADGFVVNANGSTLRGLVITGNFRTAIVVNADNVTIEGNYIGTDATGSQAGANLDHGVEVLDGAIIVRIGGATPDARNVISGTTDEAIIITGPTASNNAVQGNYIGTNAQGTAALGNVSDGIAIYNGASNNVIQDNLISGNATGISIDGVASSPNNNSIIGNLIGTDAAGSFAIANSVGILLRRGATGTTIGGSGAAQRNVISGNTDAGIRIEDAATSGNVVIGNYIGTDIGGTAALGNGNAGVHLGSSTSNNMIGGSGAGEGNVISANGAGVLIDSSAFNNSVQGNLIGRDALDSADLGNTGDGVLISGGATSNRIGGLLAGEANVIAHSGGAGVMLAAGAGAGNAILTNSIYDSGGLGIDIDPLGVTATNAPLLSSAITDGAGNVTVSGTIAAAASTTYRIEFFASPTGDASGHGEGQIYLGFVDVVTDGSGNANINTVLSGIIPPGYIVTATSTDAANNTSEFGANVVAVSVPPAIDLDFDDSSGQTGANYQTTFTEGGPPVNVADIDATVTDPDTTIAWMTVTITNLLDGVLESLSADTTGTSIVASYDSGTGVLTLSGVDTAANYQQVLRTVLYDNTAGEPDTTTRVLQIVANDGESSGNVAIANIAISLMNDAPVLTPAAPTLPTITEDETNNGGILISTLLGGSVSDADSGAVEGIAVTGLVSGNGTWQYSLDGGASWLDVGTVSNASALLLGENDRIRFVPDAQNADSASFTYRAWDQTSGSAGSKVDVSVNGGTTAFSTATDTASITVTAVNDAPVLTPTSPTLPTITENDTNNAGVLVSTLLGGSVSDVDIGAVEGIAITGLSSTNGTWQYSLDGGASWLDVGAVSELSALLLADTDRVRFLPDGVSAGVGSFTFRAWDQSSGSAGIKVDVTTNGGTTAFSSAFDTASIVVTSVNDAPVLTPAAPALPTITEDETNNGGILVSTLLGGSVSDVDSGAVEGIAITSLASGNGTWQYSLDGGASWLDVGAVSETSALLLGENDLIRFVPDAQNADSASFSFRAWDQTSGSAGSKVDVSTNGGTTAFSSATDTASITVTAINDAPVLTPAAPSLPAITEDETNNGGILISTLLGGSVGDVDTGAVEGIAITGLASGNGTWQYSLDGGASWLDVGAVSNSSALLLGENDRIRFVPDGQNADSASFTFRAWDQTSGSAGSKVDVTVNGGTTAFSGSTDTASITVTAVNDAPVLTPAAPALPTISEDDTNNAGILISTLLGGSVTDVDTGALEGIAITGLASGNGTWQYSLDGGASWLDVGAVSNTSALLLGENDRIRFVPDGQNADSASFTFHAWDQTSGSAGSKVDVSVNGGTTAFSTAGDSATITVTAVNEAPVLTPAAPTLPTITEDDTSNAGILIATLLGGSVSDVDTGAVEGIAITGLASGNGTWQYSLDGGASWLDVGAVSDTSALLLGENDRIRFLPDGQNADSASFTFRAWDQTSGSAGIKVDVTTNGGTTAFSSAFDTASIVVTSVNDAPVLTPAAPALPTITEDETNNGGILVSTLLGGSVSDVDSGALEGIAITSLASGNGTWQYSLDGGASWLDVGAVSQTSALLLGENDLIRFVPDAQNADSASFTFRAWDQTTGSAGSMVDASVNGGTTAFSAASDTAAIIVTAVNDAPVLTPAAPTLPSITEDDTGNAGILISTLLGASVSDIDLGAVEGIAITSLASGNGTWQYSLDGGTTWLDVGAVSDSSALLLAATDRIRFVPDGIDADAASFSFRAWDQTSGVAGAMVDVSVNGGTSAFSTATDTATITVNAVNDLPTTTGIGNVTVAEDSAPYTLDLTAYFNDAEDGAAALIFSVVGNSNPGLLDGAVIDPVTGMLTLDLAADAFGTTTLTVRATDSDGGTVETSFDLIVTPVNDAPVAIGSGALNASEDAPTLTFDVATLFADIDHPLASLTFAVVGNDNLALAATSFDPVTGLLQVDLGADMNGIATLTVRATDPLGAQADANIALTVAPVDDASVNTVSDEAQTVVADQILLFSSASGNQISVSDIDSSLVTVSLSVPAGGLTLATTQGLTFIEGDGENDITMTFTGTVADVNQALDGLSYVPLSGYDGLLTLSMATSDGTLPADQRAAATQATIPIVIIGNEGADSLPSLARTPGAKPPLSAAPEEAASGEEEALAEDEEAAANTARDPVFEAVFDVPEAVFASFAGSGGDGRDAPDAQGTDAELISTVARVLRQLSLDSGIAAWALNDAVWNALEALREDLSSLDDPQSRSQSLVVTMATGITLTLSAGFVSWLMRAGSLLTSLLSTTPLWQRFDPLPILAGRTRDDEDNDDPDAVAAIFGDRR